MDFDQDRPLEKTPDRENFDDVRVTVKGKAPWDGDGKVRVDFTSSAKDDGTKNLTPKKDDSAAIKRERLARMASKDIRKINKKKDPRVATILSLFVAGLGHLYLGKPGIGIGLLSVYSLCIVFLALEEYYALYVLIPLAVLSAALAQRHAMFNNSLIERKEQVLSRKKREREMGQSPGKSPTTKIGSSR
ncbi:MAG: hypothetical protein SVS15_06765 [Thermodesulfobacteriota bacterium]|nr:hypothetical protein [Thermodesulfobacteriota bacterium]